MSRSKGNENPAGITRPSRSNQSPGRSTQPQKEKKNTTTALVRPARVTPPTRGIQAGFRGSPGGPGLNQQDQDYPGNQGYQVSRGGGQRLFRITRDSPAAQGFIRLRFWPGLRRRRRRWRGSKRLLARSSPWFLVGRGPRWAANAYNRDQMAKPEKSSLALFREPNVSIAGPFPGS